MLISKIKTSKCGKIKTNEGSEQKGMETYKLDRSVQDLVKQMPGIDAKHQLI